MTTGQILGQIAQFSLHAAAHELPVAIPGLPVPEVPGESTLAV
jgi:type VI secretion system secreted protein VgrG